MLKDVKDWLSIEVQNPLWSIFYVVKRDVGHWIMDASKAVLWMWGNTRVFISQFSRSIPKQIQFNIRNTEGFFYLHFFNWIILKMGTEHFWGPNVSCSTSMLRMFVLNISILGPSYKCLSLRSSGLRSLSKVYLHVVYHPSCGSINVTRMCLTCCWYSACRTLSTIFVPKK